MHKHQSIDAYYAKPRFFKVANSIIGRYVITENALSIFPLKGRVPFGVVNQQTNEPLTCEIYEMCFYSTTEKMMLGGVPYESFFESINPGRISRYDAEHVLVKPISLAEMNRILEISSRAAYSEGEEDDTE